MERILKVYLICELENPSAYIYDASISGFCTGGKAHTEPFRIFCFSDKYIWPCTAYNLYHLVSWGALTGKPVHRQALWYTS